MAGKLELKQISKAALPAALAKAERYRLLNEPELAESICLDVLAVDVDSEAARITLLLALTDQFNARATRGVQSAKETLEQLRDEYDRAYYAGIIAERWARALLAGGDSAGQAFDWLLEAMSRYEHAQTLAKLGNDDPILRWNTCARLIERNGLAARVDPHDHQGDAVPPG
jgi:hypothetical protein